MEKYCSGCDQTKSTTEFGKNKSRSDGVQSRCKVCRRADNHTHYLKTAEVHNPKRKVAKEKRRKEWQDRLIAYLRNSWCVDCNNDDIRVLEFDHLRDKQFDVGEMLRREMAWQSILDEIAKCEVVCANCHKIRTGIRNNNYRQRWFAGV